MATAAVDRYTRDRARFLDQTEVILFLCKEFWLDVFKKRVDNLKTNNRGVGPGYCSPRHRVPFDSISQGANACR